MTADPSHPYTYQDFAGGLNNYASVLLLEVYSNDSIIMKYKNGTTDPTFHVLPLNSSLDTVDGFVSNMGRLAINNTLDWCVACGNQVDRGCSAYYSQNVFAQTHNASTIHFSSSQRAPGQSVSPLAAGFIGFAVTLVTALIAGIALGYMLGGRRARKSSIHSDSKPMRSTN